MGSAWIDVRSGEADQFGISGLRLTELVNVLVDDETDNWRTVLAEDLDDDPYGFRTGIVRGSIHPHTINDPIGMQATDFIVVDKPTPRLYKVAIIYELIDIPLISRPEFDGWRIATSSVSRTKRLTSDLDGRQIGSRTWKAVTTESERQGRVYDDDLQKILSVKCIGRQKDKDAPHGNGGYIDIESGSMSIRLSKVVPQMTWGTIRLAHAQEYCTNGFKWNGFAEGELLVTRVQIAEQDSEVNGLATIVYPVTVELLASDSDLGWEFERLYDGYVTKGTKSPIKLDEGQPYPVNNEVDRIVVNDFRVRNKINFTQFFDLFRGTVLGGGPR